MMNYQEINEFLTSYKTDSYNKKQIGNNKQIIITIYEFLNKLKLNKSNIENIIRHIAYMKEEEINIPLYLELLSKSLGFAHSYDIKDVLQTVKEIHDIYFENSTIIRLEEYIHDKIEDKTKKLFLNRNNKYLKKNYNRLETTNTISNLKLASAIALNSKEYKEFLGYIDQFEKFQDFYSPILIFKTYTKVRKKLKEDKRLFWDILFGNEYTVALIKNNIDIKDIFPKNIYNNCRKKSCKEKYIQLDLFTLLDAKEKSQHIIEDINTFQICTIYNSNNLPNYREEKDLLMYYINLIKGKETIVLPKLKTKNISSHQYNLN